MMITKLENDAIKELSQEVLNNQATKYLTRPTVEQTETVKNAGSSSNVHSRPTNLTLSPATRSGCFFL